MLAQTGIDRTRGRKALAAFREYLLAETDSSKKFKSQLDLALTLQDSDQFELSIIEFKKILDIEPENIDALAGIGLNLIKVGYAETGTEKGRQQLQQAEMYLEKYIEVAPDSHKYKEEAKSIGETLKNTDQTESAIKEFSTPKADLRQPSEKETNNLKQNRATFIKTERK